MSLLVAVVAAACGTTGEGAKSRLVPTRVPDRLVLCFAVDGQAAGRARNADPMTIWGDRALPDPWAGPLVGLSAEVAKELPVHDHARAVTVRGVPGYVAPMPLFQAVSSVEWGHIVTWRDSSGRVIETAVRRADADEALRVAGLVTITDGAPELPRDVLGSQTARIYDSFSIAPYGGGSDSAAWSLLYRSGEDADGRSRLLTVAGLAGTPEDLQPMRFWALTTESTRIRGRDGLLYAVFDQDTGPFGVIWQEDPGLIVQVVGLGLDRRSVVDAAESLEPVNAAAWQKLQDDANTGDCR